MTETKPKTSRTDGEREANAEAAPEVTPRLAEAVRSWLGRLGSRLDKLGGPGRVRHVGRIRHVADGVATVAGLPGARFNELLRFPGDVYGLVFNLDAEQIGAVLLGDETELAAGDPVQQTGEVAVVPVGKALLGRVVDALGRPLDGEGGIDADRLDPVEREAPAILDRAPVVDQLVTGVKAVDALVPLGRGQRELIVGDRATGKTAVAVDAILSQRRSDVVSIYCAIGQKTTSVKRVVESLRSRGAMRRTIVVSADADDAPGLQWLAPYAAMAIGEHVMHEGGDVLLVLDDLTRHARAYRELSLLLRRPPGREAYPGDIFFIHSRLLERSTHLKKELGGGSLTALPIVETQAKNMSAYIPTNLISITDGQIVLDPDLFSKGVKPAMDAGKSVSRVGGKTQLPAIRAHAKQLRLEYAQFAELEIFTRFGATVEEETRKKIERGRRIREVLKQPRLDPLTAGEQVLILLAVDRGYLDRLGLEQVAPFERDVRERIPVRHPDLMEKIAAGEDVEDSDWDAVAASIEEVLGEFAEEPAPEGKEEPAEEAPAEEGPAGEEGKASEEASAEEAADTGKSNAAEGGEEEKPEKETEA
jgi:F-type H+-transporting ATPase subunit alpha